MRNTTTPWHGRPARASDSTRRSILLSLLLLLFTSFAQAAPRKPSILFILADDQRWDTIHALGNPDIRTPNLDALVNRGFHFNNVYCQGGMVGAVCLPSRTEIMTGKSVFHIPAKPTSGKYDQPTLGSVFRQAGYATLYCGKRSNSFIAGNEAFEQCVYCDKGVKEAPGSMGPDSPQALQPQRVADEALRFLGTLKDDQPFFIFLAPHYPHDPRVAPPPFPAMYDPAKLPLAKNFLPDHPFDNGALHIRDEELAPHPRTPEVMRRHLADYYACITNLDHHVGRVLEQLKAAGRDGDTFVIFTADQGLSVGGAHGLMGKQNLYEEFKSPLVLTGPAIPAGQSDALVYLHDLFPTCCDLAGVPIPSVCEGTSLTPVITGKQPKTRDALFAVYIKSQRMARNDQYKLLWYPKIGRYQLFDLKADPYEMHDLSDAPDHATTLATMKKLLAQQQDQFEDKEAPRPN